MVDTPRGFTGPGGFLFITFSRHSLHSPPDISRSAPLSRFRILRENRENMETRTSSPPEIPITSADPRPTVVRIMPAARSASSPANAKAGT